MAAATYIKSFLEAHFLVYGTMEAGGRIWTLMSNWQLNANIPITTRLHDDYNTRHCYNSNNQWKNIRQNLHPKYVYLISMWWSRDHFLWLELFPAPNMVYLSIKAILTINNDNQQPKHSTCYPKVEEHHMKMIVSLRMPINSTLQYQIRQVLILKTDWFAQYPCQFLV